MTSRVQGETFVYICIFTTSIVDICTPDSSGNFLTTMAKAFSTKTAEPSVSKKTSKVLSGAPSQLNQSSRKGKRAWRKNIDIQDVEHGMEEMRAEERVTG